MSLFVCDKCQNIENTALSGYWFHGEGKPKLCSKCDPKIKKWHGGFTEDKFDPKKHEMVDGFVEYKSYLEKNKK